MGAGIQVRGPMAAGFEDILTDDAVAFVADLNRHFRARRNELLAARVGQQAGFDAGHPPKFFEETRGIRESDWTVAELPSDLLDRRVEITGPVDRKMIINALNSGATHFMADFEDSNSPTWNNAISGQIHLRDAVARTIEFTAPETGKRYALGAEIATLLVRPRGWHLDEAHLLIDGEPAVGGLVDFGLFFFHNARALLAAGSGPYFYLPKLQHYLEARLWNDVFVHAQKALDLPLGTIKATVLIETLPAVFQMNEILWELRQHSSGLNCGRWDYIFSYIKTFRNRADMVIPDRGQVGMSQPFMRAYTQMLIQTCHRREVHAIGGMAAQIPIKSDPEANEIALAKVREDKEREAKDGHDGTWVAHPGLVPVAKAIFDAQMKTANQIENKRLDVKVTEDELIAVPTGTRTEAGLRQNVNVGVLYLESWLRGAGCVPLYNLMEDAATAEISRTQLWQWMRHGAALDDGRTVDRALLGSVLDEELIKIRSALGDARFDAGRFDEARKLFEQVATAEKFVDFLTLPAYDYITTLPEI